MGGCVGPNAGLDVEENIRILPPLGIESGRLARSELGIPTRKKKSILSSNKKLTILKLRTL